MANKFFIKPDDKKLHREVAELKERLQAIESSRGSLVIERPAEQRTAVFSIPEPAVEDVFEEEECHIPKPTFGSVSLKGVESQEDGKRRKKKTKEAEDPQ